MQYERTQVRITPLTVVFIAKAAAIYSLEHGLCTFTAVPRSTQPCTLHGTVSYGGKSEEKKSGEAYDINKQTISKALK